MLSQCQNTAKSCDHCSCLFLDSPVTVPALNIFNHYLIILPLVLYKYNVQYACFFPALLKQTLPFRLTRHMYEPIK